MKTLLLSIFIFKSLYSYTQNTNCDSIPWSANISLKWSDFQAHPDTNSMYGAISYISLGYHLSRTMGNAVDIAIIEINSHFYPCLSWRNTISNSTMSLLHEQTHFDIAQYFKRLFLKKILETRFTRINIEKELETLFNIITHERLNTDKDYDEGTDFSRDKKTQIIWSNKYKEMISILKDYDIRTLQFPVWN